MNHLLKVIRFYKNLKTSDALAAENYLDNLSILNNPIKTITAKDFHFLYFNEHKIYEDCCHCFNNIYNYPEVDYIPIKIKDRHFFIFPSINQIFKNHLLINDFIHLNNTCLNHIYYMKDILKLFTSSMILYSNTNHNHYEIGVIESPIFHKDATLIKDEIYKVDWYLPTFLIKDKDIETITENYHTLLKNDKDNNKILILLNRNNKFYLYIIFNKVSLTVYEALGIFIVNNITSPIHKELESAIKKIKMDV